MSQPHISFRNETSVAPLGRDVTESAAGHLPVRASALGELLLRAAECLTALLQSPTAEAGLNEPRYNVLAVLRRTASGSCSQTELATDLLQSESNLSTLLERMRKDGLISRVRSDADRRKAVVGLTPAGREALFLADQARARATATMLEALDERREAALREALSLLVHRLERTLKGIGRETTRTGRACADNRHDSGTCYTNDVHPGGSGLSRATARYPAGPTR